MKKRLFVNRDLFHLENVLFDLDNYSFDSDIISALNKLKTLVDNKLYDEKVMSKPGILKDKIILEFDILEN